jgi:protein-disulfide isomerase
MLLNIHGPSLGIGAAIAVVSILGTFFVTGLDFSNESMKNQELDDTLKKSAPIQEKDNSRVALSLFAAQASIPLGSPNASVTIVEFGDYQCFFCNKFFHSTEQEIVKNYVDTGKVKIIFKDFTIIGQDSVNAANATHCANEEGKFWEYHDILYNNWTGENNGWASLENLAKFAREVGLDEASFDTCMKEQRYFSVIDASNADARTLGLTGTPGFFVIGPDNSIAKIGGAQPYEVFEKTIESQLEK